MALTTKQELFVSAYCSNGYNGTKAAIEAGYSEHTAKEMASQNLTKTEIIDAIDRYKLSVAKRHGIRRKRKAVNDGQRIAGQIGIRKAHALAAALEQLGLQLLLQLLDGHGQRGLGDRQPLRRTAEMKLFGEGDKVVQQPQFHDFLIFKKY